MNTLTATNLRNKFGNQIENFSDEMLSKILTYVTEENLFFIKDEEKRNNILLDFIIKWKPFENFSEAAEYFNISLKEWDACDREEEAREGLIKEGIFFETLEDEDFRIIASNLY